MSERLLFVTGKLAAPALRDTLGRADLPFDYDVAVMKITVAALMTTDWIAKRLDVPDAVTRIMIPGMCEGDVEVIGERFGIPAEKGPNDLKALPRWFGQEEARASYGERDVRVFAEINHVPRLDRDEIFAIAEYYRDSGADVIDLGLSLGRDWLDEGPGVIAGLREAGFTLSIDTLDPDEILMADEAGRRLRAEPQRRQPAPRRAPPGDAGPDPRHARGPRQPRRDDRPPRGRSASRSSSTRSSSRSAPASPPASAATSRCAAATRTSRCSWGSATSPS